MKTLRSTAILVFAACLAPSAAAQDCVIPPTPNRIVDHQPNGTAIELYVRGHAFDLWYEDPSGYAIVQTGERWYEYAELDAAGKLRATGKRVGLVDPSTLALPRNVHPVLNPGPGATGGLKGHGAGAHGGATFPAVTGTVKNLVLLLRFSNHGPGGQNRTLPSTTDVDTIMNAVGGDPTLAPTGSVRDHYLEMSYNQLTIDSDVVGWLNVPNSESYYANGNSGLTSLTWDLITDGLNLADPSVDFSQYDVDGDGWVDAVTFLHSGYGAEWGGTDSYGTGQSDRMWSHKWQIPTWTSAEGVKVAPYHISPGLWGLSGSDPGRIGVVSHETGHFFGMPDLYDTDGSSNGNGNWGLMAAGSWGFDGSQQNPSHISAWGKSKLGWLEPQLILPGVHNAPEVELNQSVLMIDSGYPPGEYLMIENREQTGFDAVIPQEGLAIWHVDEAKRSLGSNNPNTDEGYPGQGGWPGNGSHFRLALLQADDDWDLELDVNRGDGGDIYHGGGVSLIDDGTSPDTDSYQSGNVVVNHNRILNIGNAGANVGFTYQNGNAPSITTGALATPSVGVPYNESLASSGGTGSITWTEYIPNPTYSQQDVGSSQFSATGVGQGWQGEDQTWTLNLPFQFPYYDQSYSTAYVSSNGFIDFAPIETSEPGNSSNHLRLLTRIAPMWDDLRTDTSGDDIFLDTSLSDRIKIRWRGEHFNSGSTINVSVTLFRDGRIQFDYGSSNSGLSPSVGISRGQAGHVEYIDAYDGASNLSNENSVLFTLQGGQMPPGLSLATNGTISGTPTMNGTYMPYFRATDARWRYDLVQIDLSIGGISDCNSNGVDDATDISNGTSLDCNGNGIPDECEADCDGDNIPDDCEADCDGDGTPDDCEPDCDGDGIPDDCEADCDGDNIPDDCEPDCDGDGIPDDCEADCDGDGTPDDCEPDCDGDGTPDDCETDCDGDGTPDDCQTEGDCDGNGVPDLCEGFIDCNINGVPDLCEPDCDGDGVPDDCEGDCDGDGIPNDCEPDCDGDGTPDDCEPDCDGDGIPDDCEADCDGDGTPDDCEADCDGDGLPDDCEVDCNGNGQPDDCESFADCNANGIPDECEANDCDGDTIPDDCEPDCDGDGIPDDCEVDCNGNGTPDECESFTDCNSNGIPDDCDPDCDFDGVPDDCEEDLNANGTPDDCEEIGTAYCVATVNSSGSPASISAFGSDTIIDNDVNLQVVDMPAGKFGYFLMSETQGFIPLFAGSQGNFCLGAPFVRFAAFGQVSTAQGTMDFSPDLFNLPQNTNFLPGDTWNFQLWFRDNNPTNTSNTTNGRSITF